MNKRKSFFIAFSIISIFALIFLVRINNKSSDKINEILKSEAYSYLSPSAKDYIKELYESTGEVLLTEKNKEDNVPYLNPQYVEYLSLSEEEKEQVNIIPEIYIIDYIYDSKSSYVDLPENYDLRNVDGKNYITPLKNQKSLSICWAFSAIEQAESYLMVTNKTPYSSNNTNQIFSPRQMDYALSSDGIKNYNNEYGYRKLGSAGNFIKASKIMSVGLSMRDDETFPFSETLQPKDLNDVLNYNASQYELNEAIRMPRISFSLSYDSNYNNSCSSLSDYDNCRENLIKELKQKYINQIKEYIIKYGGSNVSTVSPQSNCAFRNKDGKYIIDTNSSCYSALAAHSMQVIGWDDNYEYAYCKADNANYAAQNETCSQGTYTTGKGVWIIRNSWGYSMSYIYLTYDSMKGSAPSDPEFNFITSLTPTSNRTWDNSYSAQENSTMYKRITQNFEKKINTSEKLEKIKFISLGQNATYSFSVNANNRTYNIDSVAVGYQGLHTIDVSSYNIAITSNTFSITISSPDSYVLGNSISAFTSNQYKTPVIKTNDLVINTANFTIFSDTKNIKSDEQVSYKLYDGTKELIGYLQVDDNVVAANEVNANAKFIKKIPDGQYTLKTKYNNYSFSSNLKIEGLSLVEVTFKPNFTSSIGDYTQIFDKSVAVNLEKNRFTREGFEFVGWNTRADGKGIKYSEESTITINSDLTLYAEWKEITYNISFNANTGVGEMNDVVATYHQSIVLPTPQFTKTGYNFIGWNTKKNGTGELINYDQVIQVTNNMVLYAQWQAKTYIVNFEYKFKEKSGSINSETFTYDKLTLMPGYSSNEEEGYTFAGWGTQADGQGTNYLAGRSVKNLTTSSSINLYTIWNPITYVIRFHSNNDENLTHDQTLTYDIKDNLMNTSFIKTGYRLKEWNTKEDGTGITYQNQQQVVNLLKDQDDVIDLYAIWEKEFDYVINIYSVDNTNMYISKIMVNTDLSEFTSNIILGNGYNAIVDYKEINNRRLLYTGGKTKIYEGSNLYKEYTNVVIGDINGDGAINSADLLKIRQHLLGSNVLSGYYFLSSDINYDNKINSADLLRVRQHLLGTKAIE